MNSFRENKLVLFHTSYKDYYISQEKNEKKKEMERDITFLAQTSLTSKNIYLSHRKTEM